MQLSSVVPSILSLRISRVDFISGTLFGGHNEYVVEIDEMNSYRSSVSKRYRDFFSFHRQLVAQLQCESVVVSRTASLEASPIPQFPPKRLLGNLDPGFIERRRTELETYLQQLLEHPKVVTTTLFWRFIDADNATATVAQFLGEIDSTATAIERIRHLAGLLDDSESMFRILHPAVVERILYFIERDSDVQLVYLCCSVLSGMALRFSESHPTLTNHAALRTLFGLLERASNESRVVLVVLQFGLVLLLEHPPALLAYFRAQQGLSQLVRLLGNPALYQYHALLALLVWYGIEIPEIQLVLAEPDSRGMEIIVALYESCNVNARLISGLLIAYLVIKKRFSTSELVRAAAKGIAALPLEIQDASSRACCRLLHGIESSDTSREAPVRLHLPGPETASKRLENLQHLPLENSKVHEEILPANETTPARCPAGIVTSLSPIEFDAFVATVKEGVQFAQCLGLYGPPKTGVLQDEQQQQQPPQQPSSALVLASSGALSRKTTLHETDNSGEVQSILDTSNVRRQNLHTIDYAVVYAACCVTSALCERYVGLLSECWASIQEEEKQDSDRPSALQDVAAFLLWVLMLLVCGSDYKHESQVELTSNECPGGSVRNLGTSRMQTAKTEESRVFCQSDGTPAVSDATLPGARERAESERRVECHLNENKGEECPTHPLLPVLSSSSSSSSTFTRHNGAGRPTDGRGEPHHNKAFSNGKHQSGAQAAHSNVVDEKVHCCATSPTIAADVAGANPPAAQPGRRELCDHGMSSKTCTESMAAGPPSIVTSRLPDAWDASSGENRYDDKTHSELGLLLISGKPPLSRTPPHMQPSAGGAPPTLHSQQDDTDEADESAECLDSTLFHTRPRVGCRVAEHNVALFTVFPPNVEPPWTTLTRCVGFTAVLHSYLFSSTSSSAVTVYAASVMLTAPWLFLDKTSPSLSSSSAALLTKENHALRACTARKNPTVRNISATAELSNTFQIISLRVNPIFEFSTDVPEKLATLGEASACAGKAKLCLTQNISASYDAMTESNQPTSQSSQAPAASEARDSRGRLVIQRRRVGTPPRELPVTQQFLQQRVQVVKTMLHHTERVGRQEYRKLYKEQEALERHQRDVNQCQRPLPFDEPELIHFLSAFREYFMRNATLANMAQRAKEHVACIAAQEKALRVTRRTLQHRGLLLIEQGSRLSMESESLNGMQLVADLREKEINTLRSKLDALFQDVMDVSGPLRRAQEEVEHASRERRRVETNLAETHKLLHEMPQRRAVLTSQLRDVEILEKEATVRVNNVKMSILAANIKLGHTETSDWSLTRIVKTLVAVGHQILHSWQANQRGQQIGSRGFDSNNTGRAPPGSRPDLQPASPMRSRLHGYRQTAVSSSSSAARQTQRPRRSTTLGSPPDSFATLLTQLPVFLYRFPALADLATESVDLDPVEATRRLGEILYTLDRNPILALTSITEANRNSAMVSSAAVEALVVALYDAEAQLRQSSEEADNVRAALEAESDANMLSRHIATLEAEHKHWDDEFRRLQGVVCRLEKQLREAEKKMGLCKTDLRVVENDFARMVKTVKEKKDAQDKIRVAMLNESCYLEAEISRLVDEMARVREDRELASNNIALLQHMLTQESRERLVLRNHIREFIPLLQAADTILCGLDIGPPPGFMF